MKSPFRAATIDDVPAIVAMRDRLNALELAGCRHASIEPLTVAQFAQRWGPTFGHEDYHWAIVEDGGRAVGFGLIYLTLPVTEPPHAFLHWAYLEPEFRRHGLGRLLVDDLVGWARRRGADRVELQFIDGNLPAEHFWQAMAFQPFARKCVRYL
jgi:GNAT superfamily N-acetyltransferase